MRYSVRWILALALAVAAPGCGGSGGSASNSSKGRPQGASAGYPDPLFGLTGAVVRNPSRFMDGPVAMKADADAIYVLSNCALDQSDGFGQIEKRSLLTGALVPGFGTGGVVTSNPSAGHDSYQAMAADADHLYLAGTDVSIGGSDAQWRIEKRTKAAGTLDPNFGNMGVLLINPTIGWDQPSHLLIDGDSLIIAGNVMESSVRIEKRSLQNGAPDPTFANGSPWAQDLLEGPEIVGALSLHATGLYVAVVPAWADGDWMIFRLLPSTGEWDFGFAPGAALLVNPSTGFDELRALEVRDGNLYLAGRDFPAWNGRWHVQRWNLANLQPDAAFGTGGILIVDCGPGIDWLASIEFSGTSFYLTGSDSSLTQGGWRIERRSMVDGALVAAFGVGGVAVSDTSPRQGNPYATVVADGALFIAGDGGEVHNGQLRIERRSLETGALSLAFGSPGTLTVDRVPTVYDAVSAMVKDGAHLYVAAVEYVAAPSDYRWRIEKRHASSGNLDGSFGVEGVVIVDPSTGQDVPAAMAVADGWLFIGGIDRATSHTSWRIEKRSTVDGSLDPGFADAGVYTWPTGGDYDELRAIMVVGDHLFAAGDSTIDINAPWDRQWDLLKLKCVDGQPAWGVDGHVVSNSSPNWDGAYALASDGVSLYITGVGNAVGLDIRWRTEKRSLETGAFDPAFGPGGWVEENNGPGQLELPSAVAVANGALYVGGLVQDYWRLEKRNATTGARVGGFGTDGVVVVTSPVGYAELRAISVEGNALFLAGTCNLGGRVEKRDTVKGKLVSGFGTGGVVALPGATLTHLALEPGALFVGGVAEGSSGNDLMFLHKMSR